MDDEEIMKSEIQDDALDTGQPITLSAHRRGCGRFSHFAVLRRYFVVLTAALHLQSVLETTPDSQIADEHISPEN